MIKTIEKLSSNLPLFLSDDASRVLLTGGKDDYINASHIGVSLLPTIPLLVMWYGFES